MAELLREETAKSQQGAQQSPAGTELPKTFVEFIAGTLGLTETLTREQLVYCWVVFDKVEPRQLKGRDREIARKLFGEVEEFPSAARHVACTLKGARVGGSWLHSLYLVFVALTADLSALALGEVGFAIIVGPDLRIAKQDLRYCKGALKETPALAGYLEGESETLLQIRRPDGKAVHIECLPATRGGSAVRSRSMVGVLLDEAAFFRDDTAVVNAGEIFRAVVMRVLPGGLLSVISTVWSETDLLWEKVQQNWGKPENCLAAKAPTLLMRHDELIKQVVADEYERDAENAAREFDLEPFGAGTGLFFVASSIAAARDASLPENIPLVERITVGAGVDTGLVNDSSAAVIVHRDGNQYTVASVREMRPEKGRPLLLSKVCESYAELLHEHRKTSALADQHELEASREHMQANGVWLDAAPAGNAAKFEAYQLVRNILNEGRLAISAEHKRLLAQLRDVCSRPLPGGGIKIWSPRKGGHGDLVSALVNAVWQAHELGAWAPPDNTVVADHDTDGWPSEDTFGLPM